MFSLKPFHRAIRRQPGGPLAWATLALLAAGSLRAAGTFNVTTYGAVGNSATNDTAAIQKAINAASAAGGGTVLIPPAAGSYLSDELALASNIDLSISAGAMLQMEPYGTFTSPTNHFLDASKLSNVTINGGGVIDGQGQAWWTAFRSSGVNRPDPMVYFADCTNVVVEDITLQNSPKVNQQYWSNTGVLISNEKVYEPYASSSNNISPNTDGMDIASTNMVIQYCNISDGDDVIAIGSSGHYANNITITGCTFGTGHGVSIGSHTTGGVNGLWVTNCTFTGTQYGLRLKSDRGNGGLVTNVNYDNLTMTGIVYYPIYLFSYYGISPSPTGPTDDPGGPATLTSTTPQWRNITFSNIDATTAGGAKGPMQMWALPEAKATNVLFDNVRLTGPGNAEIYHASNVSFTCTCRINGAVASPSDVVTSDATVSYLACGSPTPLSTLMPTSGATSTFSRTASPTASPTQSPTASATPTATATPTKSASASPMASATASPVATGTASRTATGTASPIATGTASPIATDTASPIATDTASPIATDTASPIATGTASPIATDTASPIATDTASPIATDTASPIATDTASPIATDTASPIATDTASPIATDTATRSLTATLIPALTGTPSATATATASPSPTATSSATAGPPPSPTAKPTATPAARATATAAATATPALGPGGPLVIDRQQPWPNPNPRHLAVHLLGNVDQVRVRIWTIAMRLVSQAEAGPLHQGWNDVPVPGAAGLPSGLYYVTVSGNSGSIAAKSPPPARMLVLH